MTQTPESAPTARPAAVLLRGGAIPAALTGVLVAGLSLLASPRAGGSALLGAAIASVALCAGPALMALTRTMAPPAVMAVALAGYGITVGLLALVYALLGGASWLSGDHVGYGIVAATVAWLAGQVRAVAALRVLAFGSRPVGDPGPSGAGQGGSPASP